MHLGEARHRIFAKGVGREPGPTGIAVLSRRTLRMAVLPNKANLVPVVRILSAGWRLS